MLEYAAAFHCDRHLGAQPPTRHGFDFWLGTPYSHDEGLCRYAHRRYECPSATREKVAPVPLMMQGERERGRTLAMSRVGTDEAHVFVVILHYVGGAPEQIVEQPVNLETLTARYAVTACLLFSPNRAADNSLSMLAPGLWFA